MLLHQIALKNLLSFGPNTKPLELGRLSVLIGPNGSGKSNLIEAIGLLKAAPHDLAAHVRKGGGLKEFLHKCGHPDEGMVVTVLNQKDAHWLVHSLSIGRRSNLAFAVMDNMSLIDVGGPAFSTIDLFKLDRPGIKLVFASGHEESLHLWDFDQSILSQLRDPKHAPEVTFVGQQYETIRVYRDWSFGQDAPLRVVENSNQPNGWLNEDCSNLAAVLDRLLSDNTVKRRLVDHMQQLYAAVEDIVVESIGDFRQILLRESTFTTPALRLSDGTLRYLCLLAIFCDPKPPPLICLEEPELGLHPDVIPTIAELLKEASERTQVIVTTHSDTLVDCFTSSPEDVVVCEKHDGQTEMTRLDGERLSQWLEEYSLGTLWSQGQIGGNRW